MNTATNPPRSRGGPAGQPNLHKTAAPRKAMEAATTYAEWRAAAIAHDERSGASQWRRHDVSSRYDYRVIRRRMDELRRLRRKGDPHALLFFLNEGMHGNVGGIGSSGMYTRAKFGTKDLITDYLTEMSEAVAQVAAVPDTEIPAREKLDFFRRASICYGRSALMLSGGGALGPFHFGVVKALLQEDLLPNVISGASAGSIVTAILGTQTNEALHELFADGQLERPMGELQLQERLEGAPISSAVRGRRIDINKVISVIDALIPDMTFAEAFELTGRHINITVSPKDVHQQSRLLNAVTSPNVFIREAVRASCAIPGIFPPVTLAAKNVHGQRQPYVPSRQWVDGSVSDDLPAKRLARLYQANHFITSQTNPIVLWALTDPGRDDLLSRSWNVYQKAVREWFRATYPFAMQLTKNLYPLNLFTRIGYSIAIQDYTADVTILPRRRVWDPRKLLSELSEEETLFLIHQGEQATWPKIEMIRNASKVSRAIDSAMAPLEAAIGIGA
ncbi:MAG: DUF3336 domain-containing protein [Pseudomonadota bacterium]